MWEDVTSREAIASKKKAWKLTIVPLRCVCENECGWGGVCVWVGVAVCTHTHAYSHKVRRKYWLMMEFDKHPSLFVFYMIVSRKVRFLRKLLVNTNY